MTLQAAKSKAEAADHRARISMNTAIATRADFMRDKAMQDAEAALRAWREVWRLEEELFPTR